MKTCVLFDFDGTIINTNTITKKGLDLFSFKARGVALTEAEHQMLMGRPLEDQIRYIDEESAAELTEAFKDWYQEAHATEVSLFEGVAEVLESLRSYGYPMGIVTNNSRETVMHGLRQFGIDHFFDCLVSCDDVLHKKPEPEGLYKAMALMGYPAKHCIFIGDTKNDILAANRAGVISVLVGWTTMSEAEQKALKVDYCIEAPYEIFSVIGLNEAANAS